mgnify:CR=1 FL=1
MRINLLFLSFVILFHFLFWQEGLGINLVFFAILALAYQRQAQKRPFKRVELLYLLPFASAALGVLLVNTSVSVVVLILSFAAYAG